jgi:GGDEF domain-containing protein
LLSDVMDEESLKLELQKIQKIFEEPVADNFTEHDISASIGVSVFPEPGSSAKKLIEQTILSIQKAQKEGGRRMQIFGI